MTDRERRAAASPSAWWLWAVVLAAALGALPLPARLVCLAAVVVVTHRSLTTESERVTYGFTLRLAASLVVFRVVIQLLLGADLSTNVLFTLPRLALPLGLHIGGAISLDAFTSAIDGGTQLAAVILCVGSASLFCPPALLLESLPHGLTNLAMVLSAATSFLPSLARDASNLKAAARWRGEEQTKWGWVARQAVPLAEGALERSLKLAASVQLRRPAATARERRPILNAVGWLAVCAGAGLWLYNASSASLLLAAMGLGLVIASTWRSLSLPSTARQPLTPQSRFLLSAAGVALACVWLGQPWVAAVAVLLLAIAPAAILLRGNRVAAL